MKKKLRKKTLLSFTGIAAITAGVVGSVAQSCATPEPSNQNTFVDSVVEGINLLSDFRGETITNQIASAAISAINVRLQAESLPNLLNLRFEQIQNSDVNLTMENVYTVEINNITSGQTTMNQNLVGNIIFNIIDNGTQPTTVTVDDPILTQQFRNILEGLAQISNYNIAVGEPTSSAGIEILRAINARLDDQLSVFLSTLVFAGPTFMSNIAIQTPTTLNINLSDTEGALMNGLEVSGNITIAIVLSTTDDTISATVTNVPVIGQTFAAVISTDVNNLNATGNSDRPTSPLALAMFNTMNAMNFSQLIIPPIFNIAFTTITDSNFGAVTNNQITGTIMNSTITSSGLSASVTITFVINILTTIIATTATYSLASVSVGT